MPRWNSLSVLPVPQPHSASLVAPWAGEDRLAITGLVAAALSAGEH